MGSWNNYGKSDKVDIEALKKKYGVDFQSPKPDYLKEFINWVMLIIAAVLIALVIRTFAFEWVVVSGPSMEDTLYNNEILFVNKLGYIYSEPQRGDIVIMEYKKGDWNYLPFHELFPFVTLFFPQKNEVNYVKRVVGIPGDTIDIRDGSVYINNVLLDEPYIKGLSYPKSFELPAIIPNDHVFLLGDNRENSQDSRNLGFIEYEKVKGKVTFRMLPFDSFGNIYNNMN
ncbi:UNVERIFIED_CONTAM: signal peptidase I [Acetivibrio alkalicellulosi]